MTSLPEKLALELSAQVMDTWTHDTVSCFVWEHDDVDIASMSDAQVDNLVREVNFIAHHRIILSLKEK
jgi:hypothetical protein